MSERINRSKLTFSQAEGIDPLPQVEVLGELPKSARNRLWGIIYNSFCKSGKGWDGVEKIGDPWLTTLYRYHVLYLQNPPDEFDQSFQLHCHRIKELILNSEYNRVIDFLEYVLRSPSSALRGLRRNIGLVLEECMCAYTIIEDRDGPSIIPTSLPEQRKSIEEAFESLAAEPFKAARKHLMKSAECIKSGDPHGSIRESIHAVESVARRLDAGAATSLKPALYALSKKITLHPAFKKGVEILYGYTSDAGGIRHADVDDKTSVDKEDALFMFGACAAFSAYLVNKARKAGIEIK